MSNVSTAAAATAAGISETELVRARRNRQTGQTINFAALARLVGLNPAKLEGIANGWLPAEKDLSLWRELRVFTTAGDGMTVNCYLVWDEVHARRGAVRHRPRRETDSGWHRRRTSFSSGTFSSRTRTGITSRRCRKSARPGRKRGCTAVPKTRRWTSATRPSEIVHLGGLRVTHRETPGHAEDGVTYIVGNWQEDAPHVAIRGRRDFRRLHRARQPVVGSGAAKSAGTNSIAAAGNVDLPRPRPVDDGGGGKGTQSVLLIYRCFDWQRKNWTCQATIGTHFVIFSLRLKLTMRFFSGHTPGLAVLERGALLRKPQTLVYAERCSALCQIIPLPDWLVGA